MFSDYDSCFQDCLILTLILLNALLESALITLELLTVDFAIDNFSLRLVQTVYNGEQNNFYVAVNKIIIIN